MSWVCYINISQGRYNVLKIEGAMQKLRGQKSYNVPTFDKLLRFLMILDEIIKATNFLNKPAIFETLF